MLPDGVKSLAEISDYPDPAVRVPLLTTLLEYLLKYATPSGEYVTLEDLIEQHSKQFANVKAIKDARWTRNRLSHGKRATRAQINEAEVSLEDAIHDLLKSSDFPERLRMKVEEVPISPSPHHTNQTAATGPEHESGFRPTSSAPPPVKAAMPRPPVATPAARVPPLIRTSELSPRKLRSPVAAPAGTIPPPVRAPTNPTVPKSAATPQEPPDRKKVRINELARELEVPAHKILERLPELGVPERLTHSSSVSDDIAAKLRRLYRDFACPVCDARIDFVDLGRGDDVVCSSCRFHLLVVLTEGDFGLVVLDDDRSEDDNGSDKTDFGIGGP
jgi:hypothetical protein